MNGHRGKPRLPGTDRVVDSLVMIGRASEIVGQGVTESQARARLYNAAKLAKVKISTTRWPDDGKVRAVRAEVK